MSPVSHEIDLAAPLPEQMCYHTRTSTHIRSPALTQAEPDPPLVTTPMANLSRPELVFAFVSPLGTDSDSLVAKLTAALSDVGYDSTPIHLSGQLTPPPVSRKKAESDAAHHYRRLMIAGNRLCAATNNPYSVALLGVKAIRERRTQAPSNTTSPPRGDAFLIRSLKRPAEVSLLRQIYSDRLFVIGAYASRSSRAAALKKRVTTPTFSGPKVDKVVDELLDLDQFDDDEKFGQNVGATFHLADAFIEAHDKATIEASAKSLVSLLFGEYHRTPSKFELAMFHAYAASLRSASLSRQVGAALVDSKGELLATGCNEVPKFSGGQYWAGDDPDERDHQRGYDASDQYRRSSLEDVLKRLKQGKFLKDAYLRQSPSKLLELALKRTTVASSLLFDSVEYARAVHAEMAALISCARRGTATAGAQLATTTFPCHDCAKHIVAAGVTEVVFIDPYVKSQVESMYDDSITVGGVDAGHVSFSPYVGLAPRLFSRFYGPQNEKLKMPDGSALKWRADAAMPRIGRGRSDYLILEQQFLTQLQA